MEPDEEEGKNKIIVGIFIAAVILISGAIIWFVGGMLSEPVEPPKKTVQEIKVIRPPPPPPEIEEEPPPPEPEIEEEVDIPEPEDIPDIPDIEPAASDPIGLDAEGGAGGDAFGLLGKKGGKGLIGSGTGDRNLWYAGNVVQPAVLDKLVERTGLLALRYRIRLNVWVNEAGEVTKFKLLESTGDPEIDSAINIALASLKRLKTLPPPNMPQPVRLAIEAR